MQRPLKIPKKPSLALDTNIVQDNVPQKVLPGIFIGSIHAAFNQEALLENGISHILNASRVPATFPKNFTYLSIDIRDREDANILSCIPASNIFLEAGIDAGGVLIHCFGGRSRSAALVAAFLMSSRGWTLEQALDVVVAARPVAAVNRGFDRQLRAYMETNYDVYAAQQVLLRNRISSLQHVRGQLHSKGGGKFDPKAMGSGEVRVDDAAGGTPHASGQKRWRNTSSGNLTAGYDGTIGIDMGGRTECAAEDEEDKMSTAGVNLKLTTLNAKTGVSVLPITEGSAPNCRLSRPGSSTVRVIPPLRGLERRYGCVSCGRSLFSLANVVREGASAAEFVSTGKVASPGPSSEAQFKMPMPSASPRDNVHRLQSKGDVMTVIGQSSSAPIIIPAAPQSRRHAEAKAFSFGDDVIDSMTDVKDVGADNIMLLSRSPETPEFAPGGVTPVAAQPRNNLSLPLKTMNRPQSAEKRRWLARVSLLKADSKDSMSRPPAVPDAKAAKLAADDQGMVDIVDKGCVPFFCIEYLGWMGLEPLGDACDEGKLDCPGCGRFIGSWSWSPQDSAFGNAGSVGPPVFKALRSAVQLADLPLDSTPMSTPRLDALSDEMDTTTEGGDGSMPRDGSMLVRK